MLHTTMIVVFVGVLLPMALGIGGARPDAGGDEGAQGARGVTDNQALDRFIRHWDQEAEGGGGQWSFRVEQTRLMVLSDEAHNRMRVFSADELDEGELLAMHPYPFDAIAEQLETITRSGDLVVTMGAGDVWRVAHAY